MANYFRKKLVRLWIRLFLSIRLSSNQTFSSFMLPWQCFHVALTMLAYCLDNAFMLPWQCLIYKEEFLGLNSYVKNWVVLVRYFYFRMNTWFFRILEKVMKSRNNFKNYFFMFFYHWFFNFAYVHKSELPGYYPCINLPFLDTLPPIISLFSY